MRDRNAVTRDPSLDPPYLLSERVENGVMAVAIGACMLVVVALGGFLLALACGNDLAWRIIDSISAFYDGAPQ